MFLLSTRIGTDYTDRTDWPARCMWALEAFRLGPSVIGCHPLVSFPSAGRADQTGVEERTGKLACMGEPTQLSVRA